MERTSPQAPSDAVQDHPAGKDERSPLATRRYRSKVQRPCDFCRRRKVHCNITNPSRPCQLCERFQRSCTFLEKPHRKGQRGLLPRAREQEKRNGQEHEQEQEQEHEPEHEQEHSGFVGEERIGESLRAGNHSTEPSFSLDNLASDRGQSVNSSEINNDYVQRNHFNPTVPTWEHSNTVPRDMLIARDTPDTAADQMQPTSPDCYIDAFNSQFPDSERSHNRHSGANCDSSIHHPSASKTSNLLGIKSQEGWLENDLVEVHGRPTKRQRRGRSLSSGKSLDTYHDYTSQLFGLSGESDPYLLDFYPYGNNHEFRFSKVIYRQLQREQHGPSRTLPAQFLLSHNSITATAQTRAELDATGMGNMSTDREELDQLISEDHRVPLFEIFIDHVFHAVPVVSRSRFYADPKKSISEMPTALLAAIYATALPFSAWDDKLCVEDVYSSPSTDFIWRIAHRCLAKEMSCARLSTVQAAILLLHRPVPSQFVANPPTSWASVTSALAVAQSLGLHMDPRDWDLPQWEIRLRRRLWWTLFVEEKWRALTYGRPSHINCDDWHVTAPTDMDFELDFETPSQPVVNQLILMASLTMIVDEIYQSFYTIKAVLNPRPLPLNEGKAREFLDSLEDWKRNLPPSCIVESTISLDGNHDNIWPHGHLHVAYFTARILVLRALFRMHHQIVPPTEAPLLAVAQTSIQLLNDEVQFFRNVNWRTSSAFWPSYMRNCFSYPGHFMFLLFLALNEHDLAEVCRKMLWTWRRILKAHARAWPLLQLAVLRMDGIFWSHLDQIKGLST